MIKWKNNGDDFYVAFINKRMVGGFYYVSDLKIRFCVYPFDGRAVDLI